MPNTEYFVLVILFFSIFLLILKKEKLSKWSASIFSQKEKERYQQVCPKCGSRELKNNFTNIANLAYGGPIGKICKACGYEGQFYIEAKKGNSKKLHTQIKSKNKNQEIQRIDPTFGKGYAFFLAKIFGVISILLGAVIIIIDEELFTGIASILWGIFLLYCGKKN